MKQKETIKQAIEFTGVFIKSEQGGYMAYLQEIPAVASEGDNIEEAAKNLFELLPDVWKIQAEIASEKGIISGSKNDEKFIIKTFPFIPAVV